MTSDAPGPGSPGPGQPPTPGDEATAAEAWPAELVPPPVPQAPSTGWGSPTGPAPAPAPAPAPPGQWGAPAAPPAAGSTPPPAGGWGTPAPPPSTPPGAWGAPPVQGGDWASGPGAPGSQPPGTWAPAPAGSGNGCLKGCLIVGVVVVVLGILGVIGMGIFAARFVEDAGINVDGTFDQCQLISASDVEAILGPDAAALPLGGFVDSTIGQVLDKRLLPDAPDCWLVAGSGSSITGRLARQDGNSGSVFQAARQAAQDGGFLAEDVSFGDEAFCTSPTDFGGSGALVRRGDRVAYVSLLDAGGSNCELAGRLAEAALR